MRKLISLHWITIVMAFMLVAVNPAMALAEAVPTAPVGYTLNAATGMWENGTYAWDPATGQSRPLTPTNYSYNPATGRWDTTDYVYSPSSGNYIPNTPPPAPSSVPQGVSNVPSTTSSPQTATPTTSASSNPTSNSTTTALPTGVSTVSHLFDNFFNASISNHLNSAATTGNATVAGNTTAGDAATGNATTIANLINLLHSSWTSSGGAPMTFMANIVGNVVGDLTIDPSQIGHNAATAASSSPTTNTVVNNTNNGRINNTLDLSSTTGKAAVDSNTTAGGATTGNATVLANLVNAINSSISSGKSFMGIINILGNLNGDILLPPGLIDQIIASNKPGSAAIVNSSVPTQLTANNTDNQSISNNVSADAKSGAATVANNTSAGNAATGSATTNVTLLNLTGRQVVDANTLLVFVNVLGHWVGVIMNAPTGTTAAALGGGVQSSSSAAIASNDLTLNNTTNSQISNQINGTAKTGDASVTNNTNAGSATTGNANIGVNILNMTGSQFSSANWFGVLFINVLGEWTGSFGVNTSAGDPASTPNSGSGSTASTSNHGSSSNRSAPHVFGFIPRSYTSKTTDNSDSQLSSLSDTNMIASSPSDVLSASAFSITPRTQSQAQAGAINDGWMFLAVVAIGIGALAAVGRMVGSRNN